MHKVFGILSIIVLVYLCTLSTIAAENSYHSRILFSADIINVDFIRNIHGGYIKWSFEGNVAISLRECVDSIFGNADGYVSEHEAFSYFRFLDNLIENYSLNYGKLGTVRIARFSTLHGTKDNTFVDKTDVAGLISSVKSSEPITINGEFEATEIYENESIVTKEIVIAPLIASVRKNLDIFFKKYGGTHEIEVSLTNTILPLGTYSINASNQPLIIRFVVGTFFKYSRTTHSDLEKLSFAEDRIKKLDFTIYENPIVLFIAVYISFKTCNLIYDHVYKKYKYWLKEREKILKWTTRVIKILVYLIYFIPTIFIIYINGIALIIIAIVIPLLLYMVPTTLYKNRKVPHKTAIDDVYLISASGILIAHATRRLKPDVDEDVLASTLVAIQDFVHTSFKDEKDTLVKYFEFGNKKVAVKKMGNFYLALVVTGELYEDLEVRAEAVVKEINEKYEKVLEKWSGRVEDFRGVKEIMEKIWKEDSTEK